MAQDAAPRRYRIGREVSLMGLARRTGFPLRAIAAPHLRHLGETLGETAFLAIGDDSVCLDRAIGSYPVKVLSIDVGARRLLGVVVSGAMLLAALDTAEAADILQRNADRLRLDPAGLLERCTPARALGHVYAPVGVVRGARGGRDSPHARRPHGGEHRRQRDHVTPDRRTPASGGGGDVGASPGNNYLSSF